MIELGFNFKKNNPSWTEIIAAGGLGCVLVLLIIALGITATIAAIFCAYKAYVNFAAGNIWPNAILWSVYPLLYIGGWFSRAAA